MTKTKLSQARFSAFKVSTCGNQIRRDFTSGLTLDEARDTSRFPLGIQQDAGGKFIWSYALTAN